jgi:uncharacterized metal-binding protein YceD (DUF177 family)
VSTPSFVVRVADLENGPQDLSCPVPEAWLNAALEGTDATARSPGELNVQLMLNGRDVVVRGRVTAQLSMPCSVTLDPVDVNVATDLFLLLTPRSGGGRSGAGGGRGAKGAKAPDPKTGVSARHGAGAVRGGPAKDAGNKDVPKEAARSRKNGEGIAGWNEDPELSDEDAARDTYDGELVVLDSFIREFIVLELPMNPRKSDLRSDEDVAIALRSAGLGSAEEPPLDPRLAPLAAIASRMRQKKE